MCGFARVRTRALDIAVISSCLNADARRMTNNTLQQTAQNSGPAVARLEDQLDGPALDEQLEAVTRYVVVNVNGNLYGMATDTTVELMSATMSQVTRVPHSPSFISGVINHRGTIIPVIDARALLGFGMRGQEANQLSARFSEFREYYTEWLDTLENAVLDNAPFERGSDPARSRFGRWYASVMEGASDNCREELAEATISAIVKRMYAPYQRMFAIVQRVMELRNQDNTDEALSVIENTRTEDFAELCDLFDQVLGAIDRLYESMLVITEYGGQKAAIAVDGVSFVADCKDSDIEPLPDTADNTEFLSGLVHRADGSYILIADIGNIYTHACVSE